MSFMIPTVLISGAYQGMNDTSNHVSCWGEVYIDHWNIKVP